MTNRKLAMRVHLAALMAAVFVALPLIGEAADKPVTNVKELAGSWQGWVNLGTQQTRVLMTIKEDGSYEASTPTGTLTKGNYYLENGKLRYKSSRSSGTAALSEERGKVYLRIVPEGPTYETGPTDYERMR